MVEEVDITLNNNQIQMDPLDTQMMVLMEIAVDQKVPLIIHIVMVYLHLIPAMDIKDKIHKSQTIVWLE